MADESRPVITTNFTAFNIVYSEPTPLLKFNKNGVLMQQWKGSDGTLEWRPVPKDI